MGKDAPEQPPLSVNRTAEASSLGDPAAAGSRRRRHVVMEKKTYAPPVAAKKRETVGERLRRGVKFQVPMVLFCLGVALLVGMVGMVYFLGVHKGKQKGQAETLERIRNSPTLLGAPAPRMLTETETVEPEKAAVAVVDKRKPGLNYLVVATYPRVEAERLVLFLKGRGLEAQTTVVHNRALYRVIALRGFDAQGLRSKEFQQYKQQILLIGREWNTARNKGPTNLSDVWPQRYDG